MKKLCCLLLAMCMLLLGGCAMGQRIDEKLPLFIKTIDRPNDGVGEVILGNVSIRGQWTADGDNSATFTGRLGTFGLEDYGEPYQDPGRNVKIAFSREAEYWVGTIPYTSANNEAKILTVYTDDAHAVWVFESEDRISFAPADHIKEVLAICETLGIELK